MFKVIVTLAVAATSAIGQLYDNTKAVAKTETGQKEINQSVIKTVEDSIVNPKNQPS